VKVGTAILTAGSALCLIFAPQIISFFRDDPEVIKVGSVALRAQAISLPLMATIVITNMMLQSMGKGIKATITSSARNGIFFIPLILILPRLFGLFGVEITQAIADLFSFLLTIPFAVSELRRM
jgi:Na+-driven multidrug efflux pump